MSRHVNLFYLSPNTTGGWVTYTAHLAAGLSALPDTSVTLYKVSKRTESHRRKFGYGLEYRNLSLSDAEKSCRSSPSVVTALQKNMRAEAAALVSCGAWMVIHDPAEFKGMEVSGATDRILTIRRAVRDQLPGSLYLPHPYRRRWPAGTLPTGEFRACSISRIDFDKHTDVILDANRLLPDRLRVKIYGFENRVYTRFKITPRYPEWVQSVCAYPRTASAATEICRRHDLTVDMSLIVGDGGGTQYTFLESMDAGSVPVIQRGWVRPNDDMVPRPEPDWNCLAVSGAAELADVVKDPGDPESLRAASRRANMLLTRHRPERVASSLVSTLWG